MNSNETMELENFLKNARPEEVEAYLSPKKDQVDNLADYLNEYIAQNDLVLSEIIKASNLSRDYAYSIFNGNRKNPTRDRVIAICLSCHMDYTHTQRALKLCNAGVLYAKNDRDAAITICINREIFDVMKVNDFLFSHNMSPLKTSKDA